MTSQSRKPDVLSEMITQRTEDFLDIKLVRDEARAFATSHAKELATEMIQWQDTALLPNGKLRELAAIWAMADKSNALTLAESTATRAAFDVLVRS